MSKLSRVAVAFVIEESGCLLFHALAFSVTLLASCFFFLINTLLSSALRSFSVNFQDSKHNSSSHSDLFIGGATGTILGGLALPPTVSETRTFWAGQVLQIG